MPAPPATTKAPVEVLVLAVLLAATKLLAKVVWLGTGPPLNPPDAAHCTPVPVDDKTCPELPYEPLRLIPVLEPNTSPAPLTVIKLPMVKLA